MNRERWRRWLPQVVLIVLAVAAAHFSRLGQFGLYEDDYWSVAPHLGEPLSHVWHTLVATFTYWPTGRPLNHFLPVVLSVLGSRLGGLAGVYALAAAWLALNGTLVFVVVRRIASDEAALVAALAYLVFPADSTRILLVHASHVQGAMTFLLLGILLWLKGGGWRAVSYPVAVLALLSYEIAFIPFLAVPLLRASDRRTTVRTWTVHMLCCAALVGGIVAIRLSTGDARAIAAIGDSGESIRRMATSLVIGPRTSGRVLFKAAIVGWRHADALALLAAALVVAGFAAVRFVGRSREEQVASAASQVWPRWLGPRQGQRGDLPWWWLFAGAAAVWSAAYGLTITNYPPIQSVGRLTSTHVAAAWPVALAIAALYEGARRRGPRGAAIAAAVFAAWLGSMVAYHQYLQREYVRAWDGERRFWRQVMALAPEAGPGWTVIAGGAPAEGSPVIFSNSWADYHAFRLIFATCLDPGPAFAHLGSMGPYLPFRRVEDGIEWQPRFWGGPFERIDPARLVLLSDDHGALQRVAHLSTPAGELVAPAVPVAPAREHWPDTPVSRLLFPERFP